MDDNRGSPWGYELLRVVLTLAYPSFPINSEAPEWMVAGMVITTTSLKKILIFLMGGH